MEHGKYNYVNCKTNMLRRPNFLADKSSEPIQILSVQFYVIVTCTFDPEWVNSVRCPFIDLETVGEIDYFVLCPVNH